MSPIEPNIVILNLQEEQPDHPAMDTHFMVNLNTHQPRPRRRKRAKGMQKLGHFGWPECLHPPLTYNDTLIENPPPYPTQLQLNTPPQNSHVTTSIT